MPWFWDYRNHRRVYYRDEEEDRKEAERERLQPSNDYAGFGHGVRDPGYVFKSLDSMFVHSDWLQTVEQIRELSWKHVDPRYIDSWNRIGRSLQGLEGTRDLLAHEFFQLEGKWPQESMARIYSR